MKIKSVIFDLDGTLIDSMPFWEESDRRILGMFNITHTPEMTEKIKAFSMREAAEYLCTLGVGMDSDEIMKNITADIFEKYRTVIKLKPYVTELLDVLDIKKIPYCIATANSRILTDTILRKYKILDRFRFIYTCAETGIKKDDPAFFPKIAARLHTLPEETVVVDDSLHCIRSAADNGFCTAAVYDELSAKEWELMKKTANYSFMDLSEFIKTAENL